MHFTNLRKTQVLGWLLVLIVPSVLLSLFVIPWIGLHAASSVLEVRDTPRKADVILVLGGENECRTAKTIELYHKGFAPKVLISGRNDAGLIREHLIAAGVPGEVIFVEPKSKNTYENATFSLPILCKMQVKSLLLVTSWFHSRRAAAVFKSGTQSIDIYSVPTKSDSVQRINKNKWLRRQVLMEYLKAVGYWGVYGIPPR